MPHRNRHWFHVKAPELLLGGLGVLLIGWWALSITDARMYQSESTRELAELRASNDAAAPASGSRGTRSTRARREGVRRGAPVGRIRIPTAGVSAVVAEGVDSRTLRRAVGHVSSTPLPGRPGRSILAAHRDGFFKHLNRVRPGDRITIETPRGDAVYRVRSIAVVKPSNTRALHQGAPSGLTLVTCYPFQFLGTAPLRYIVRADRIDGALATRRTRPITRGRNAASAAAKGTSSRLLAVAR